MTEPCRDENNERTSYTVTASFFDEDGNPVIPTAATYRIDDEDNRTNIQPATAISPLAAAVNLEITSDQNYIIRNRHPYEIRTVTVEFDYNSIAGPKHGTNKYEYKLINLYGVVDVPSASISPSASASPSV